MSKRVSLRSAQNIAVPAIRNGQPDLGCDTLASELAGADRNDPWDM